MKVLKTTKVEIETHWLGNDKDPCKVERIVTVDGEVFYRDLMLTKIFFNSQDPLRQFEFFLLGLNRQANTPKRINNRCNFLKPVKLFWFKFF